MSSPIPACPGPLEPRRPKHPPRPHACDTHCHVFGPSDRFSFAADRSYTPPDAPLAKYLGMLDTLGFERGVLVQGSAHGHDNSAMLDALERTPQRLRGVAVGDESISPDELRRWDKLGVRALRFNHFFRSGQLHYRGGVSLDTAKKLAPIMKDLGWHLQLWIDCKDMPETIPILDAIGLPVLIDHMGRTDARAGTGTRGFQSLLCRRRAGLGEGVGRAPPLHQRAGLSGGAAVPRGAGAHQSGQHRVGLRLAAPAHRRRDAQRRSPL